jgi:hypothetical protein
VKLTSQNPRNENGGPGGNGKTLPAKPATSSKTLRIIRKISISTHFLQK